VVISNSSGVTGGNIQFVWNFGDQGLSFLALPVHSYSVAGIYTINLLVSTDHNCRDTAVGKIVIHEKPQAQLTSTDACFNFPVNFHLQISPPVAIASYTVAYGNGATLNSIAPAYLYSAPGVYGVSVTIRTDSGCVASDFHNTTVYPPPVADFGFQSKCVQDTVVFSNRSFISSGTMNYFWNFPGTGNSIKPDPKIRFPLSGNYAVSLLAVSNSGCRDSVARTVPISQSPESKFGFSNSCDGFPVTFTNSSKIGIGAIQSFLWDFGDNSTSNAVSPQKGYLNKGSYTVSLVASSDKGCTDTSYAGVVVNEAPVADFSAADQCVTKRIHFSNSSFLGSGSFSSIWTFGDHVTGLEDSPDHLYQAPGSYMAQLKVVSDKGCADSIRQAVRAFSLPAVYAGRDTSIDKGAEIMLAAQGADRYYWSPDHGLSDAFIYNPRVMPEETVEYVVEGTDANGCLNADTLMIYVKKDFVVVPYNVLTPDGNGKNETWIVKNIPAYPDNHVEIFDQWNQRVYEKSGYSNEWDGKNQQGEMLPDATYYYILKFTSNKKVYSGYITLIRKP
jgi:gliding motility-associated-like protein